MQYLYTKHNEQRFDLIKWVRSHCYLLTHTEVMNHFDRKKIIGSFLREDHYNVENVDDGL